MLLLLNETSEFIFFFLYRAAHTKKKAATPQCSQAPYKQKLHLKTVFGKPQQCSLYGKVYRDGEVMFKVGGFAFVQ